MLNAKEAREQAAAIRQKQSEEQWAGVEKSIKTAVQKGEMDCMCYQSLNATVLDQLKSLGFDVENYSNSSDGPIFKIFW